MLKPIQSPQSNDKTLTKFSNYADLATQQANSDLEAMCFQRWWSGRGAGELLRLYRCPLHALC